MAFLSGPLLRIIRTGLYQTATQGRLRSVPAGIVRTDIETPPDTPADNTDRMIDRNTDRSKYSKQSESNRLNFASAPY